MILGQVFPEENTVFVDRATAGGSSIGLRGMAGRPCRRRRDRQIRDAVRTPGDGCTCIANSATKVKFPDELFGVAGDARSRLPEQASVPRRRFSGLFLGLDSRSIHGGSLRPRAAVCRCRLLICIPDLLDHD